MADPTPAHYADLAAVAVDLGLSGAWEPGEAERMEAMAVALSRQLEQRIGRRFGDVEPTATTRFAKGNGSPVLILPTPIRTVESVSIGGAIFDAVFYAPTMVGPDGARALTVTAWGSAWVGPVAVTGVWADDPGLGVPADVTEAATYLVVSFWQRRKESPDGAVGPEGVLLAPRRFDPWKDPRVAGVVAAHRIQTVTV